MNKNQTFMRKTKIICTLGPATDSEAVLRQLFGNGMNVARLNFSHGTLEDHRTRTEQFKKIRDETGIPAGLLLDTRGPEIRIKQFANKEVDLAPGASFILTVDDVPGTEAVVSVTYEGFPRIVERGDTLLLDDGLIAMRVTGTTSNEVICQVINGGILGTHTKVNITGRGNNP